MKKVEKNFKDTHGFWQKLPRPFFCLAPMAEVTDFPFREIIAKYSRHGNPPAGGGGGPDIFWTEFVSADGLDSRGREKLVHNLKFSKKQKPIVAQLFGAKPESMRRAVAYVATLGFDGIDINLGCPDRSVQRQGAGAALIKTPKLAREVVRAAIEGANGLPVSVKTRLGYNKVEIETWIPELLKEDISALIIHGRTKKEMSLVPAHWDLIKRVVEIVRASGKDIPVIGNGDVQNLAEAKARIQETGCDGIMFGRAIFGNPWLFDAKAKEPRVKDKLKVLLEHSKLFEKEFATVKNFAVMKKHYKAYVSGFDGAKELRTELMSAVDYKGVEKIVKDYLKQK